MAETDMDDEALHIHSPECLGANELDELCCRYVDGDALKASDRWVVTCHDDTILNVFTNTLRDAFALARADGRVPVAAVPDPQAWP